MIKPKSSFLPLEKLINGNLAYQSLLESVRIGLFDELEETPGSAVQIAKRLGFSSETTEALLEMLEANGLLQKKKDVFSNSEAASEYLVSGSEFYQGMALELRNRFSQSVIENFQTMLKGESPARKCSDESWGMAESMVGTLQHAKLGMLQDTTDFISGLPGFEQMRKMADIGGNHGEYSIRLMDRNPDLTGEILDLPGVVETANELINTKGYAHRLEAKSCDLREKNLLRGEYDLVLASNILYAFMDDLPRMMRTIRDSLKPGGWFVSQHMNPDSDIPPVQKSSLEFITRMAGYPTHFISQDTLESAFDSAGFEHVRAGKSVCRCGSSLILAARID